MDTSYDDICMMLKGIFGINAVKKVLATENFFEVGRAELVGDHVGATAPLVKKRFRQNEAFS